MKYIYPAVYNENVPENFLTRFPFLEELKPSEKKNSANTSMIQNFKSINGLDFYDFAKTRKYGGGIVSCLVLKIK